MKITYTGIFMVFLLTLMGCEKTDGTSGELSGSGQGGSLARFAIEGGNLYTVNSTSLKLFSLGDPSNPALVNAQPISNSSVIETIFIRDDSTMFIGSQEGVYIYSIKTPTAPLLLSHYSHIRSCDPVVADAHYAFATLRVGGSCSNGVNQLEVIDLSDLRYPTRLMEYPMTNPQGLGLKNNLLFVCDEGLSVYDRSDVYNLQLVEKFMIPAIDVIPVSNRLIVLAEDGLYQYTYSTGSLVLLSHLSLN